MKAYTPAPIEPSGMFDGLQWSPILIGAVLDNVLSVIALLPIMLYFAGGGVFSEDEETINRAVDEAAVNPEFLFLSLVIGISITVYVGYWAARRAGSLYLRHGGWTAAASAALGLLLAALVPESGGGPTPPLWYDVLGLALMVPAGLLGGWLASRVVQAA